jgi:hypothetical protein
MIERKRLWKELVFGDFGKLNGCVCLLVSWLMVEDKLLEL